MKISKTLGSLYYLIIVTFLVYLTFFYYPRWEKYRSEATISWDISGYYWYLPAIFIYDDIKDQKFGQTIYEKYHPSGAFDQALLHESGKYVIKYSSGWSLLNAPLFFISHLYAKIFHYDADGFSTPYQAGIVMSAFFYALLGLYYLRKLLLKYYSEGITALTLLLLYVGTNLLEYTTVGAANVHNYLFALMAIMLYATLLFYERASYKYAIITGLCIGLAGLTRPPDIIAFLLPLFWGIKLPIKDFITNRVLFIAKHLPKYLLAGFITIAIGSIQFIYWKYVTNDWIVYSYKDEGFHWLRPHTFNFLFSLQAGWLVYSPMVIFGLMGLLLMGKNKAENSALFIFYFLLYIYIASAWHCWWYGGSIGQRTMVQTYPILALPFAYLLNTILLRPRFIYALWSVFLFFLYYNLWWIHQAHLGGMFKGIDITGKYFSKVVLTHKRIPENEIYLDHQEEFGRKMIRSELIYFNDFEMDSTQSFQSCPMPPIAGDHSLCIGKNAHLAEFKFSGLETNEWDWLRASADFKIAKKEWYSWLGLDFKLTFLKGEKIVKTAHIKPFRVLMDDEQKNLHFDIQIPKEVAWDAIKISFVNNGSEIPILIDNITVELIQ